MLSTRSELRILSIAGRRCPRSWTPFEKSAEPFSNRLRAIRDAIEPSSESQFSRPVLAKHLA